MKSFSMTLGRFRLTVQLIMLVTLLYGATVMGHYLSDMVSNALPALSCAYDPVASDYCVLIPTQHQLNHRVGEAIVRMQGFAFSMLLPLFFTFINFFILFVIFNKAFCGWICPLGTIQELFFRLGRFLGRPLHHLKPHQTGKVRPIKWLMLVGLVMALPLMAGFGVAPHEAGDAFCQVCPSRIITSMAAGSTEQLAVSTSSLTDTIFGAIRAFLVGFIVIAALAIRQPFCRICPMLSLHAVFRRLSLTRLVKVQNDHCDKCGICTKACPMDIPEIWQEHGPKAFNEDCTLCGRCAEFCPQDSVISIKTGPLTVFKSSREHYKKRVKQQKPNGSKPVNSKPSPARVKKV
ncbi:MAG: 4Fe-4S binding protein [Gammaproteobacteria bacterium]|nr:4Fe-4S binding protein [Gammaproteobacteria bacterium]